MEVDGDEETAGKGQRRRGKGRQEWVTLALTLPGLRDDDPNLVFLEETFRTGGTGILRDAIDVFAS